MVPGRSGNNTCTGVSLALRISLGQLHGYLAHKKTPPPDPTVGLCLETYGGPRGGVRFLMSEVPLYSTSRAWGLSTR